MPGGQYPQSYVQNDLLVSWPEFEPETLDSDLVAAGSDEDDWGWGKKKEESKTDYKEEEHLKDLDKKKKKKHKKVKKVIINSFSQIVS